MSNSKKILSVGLLLILFGGVIALAGYILGGVFEVPLIRGELEDKTFQIEGPLREVYVDAGLAKIILRGNAEVGVVKSTNFLKDTLTISQVDGRLTVRENEEKSWWRYGVFGRWNSTNNRVLVIDLPANTDLDLLKVKTGMSSTEISYVQGKELNLDGGMGSIIVETANFNNITSQTGMGKLEVRDAICNTLNLDSGMGEVYFEGDVSEKAKIKSGMGSIKMKLDRPESEYAFRAKNGMGSISINRNKQEGISNFVFGNGSREIILESGMGSIEVITAAM